MKYDLVAMFTDNSFFYGLGCAFVVFYIYKWVFPYLGSSIRIAILISIWAITGLYFFDKWENKDFVKKRNGSRKKG